MITFAVSDVEPAKERLPCGSLEALLGQRIGKVEAARSSAPNFVGTMGHGFVSAATVAFEAHYPLVLSPDDVWLCLAQGFAAHVRLHAEELRSRFVAHQGKAMLAVRRDDFVRGSPDNDWPGVFTELSDKIAEHVGKKRDLIVADFTTTGPIERAASEVTLLEAFQAYFEYRVMTLCGIPQITLLGTANDWLSIRRRAAVFGEFGLEEWTKVLLPVLDQIVATAHGNEDPAFWRSFLKVESQSGGPYITGWVNVLFPYLDIWNSSTRKHELGPNPHMYRWARKLKQPDERGPTSSDFRSGLSTAPFLWEYLGTEIPMAFRGGFVGVSQDPETLAVRPAIGWAITESSA